MNSKNYLLPALIIASLQLLQGCAANADSSAKPALQQGLPVSATVVSEEKIAGVTSYPGTAVPLQETQLIAEVSGYITKIYVTDGSPVKKGQPLYEIDRIRYEAAVNQANANLAIANANLQKTEKDLERYQALAQKDAIAKQTLDYALTDADTRRAEIRAMEAILTTAKTNLDRSVIRAPFDGAVGISQVRLGAFISVGGTLLNTVSTIDPVAVEFQVSERDIPIFLSYQSGKSASQITLTLPDGSTYASNGKITTIDRAVNRTTGTITVRAGFPNASNILRAGMNLTVNSSVISKEQQLTIPFRSVRDELGVYVVFAINDSSKAEQRQVQLGMKTGDKVIVTSGLKSGEKIVVDGIMNVRSGQQVIEKAAK